jgi:hypothetical protein
LLQIGRVIWKHEVERVSTLVPKIKLNEMGIGHLEKALRRGSIVVEVVLTPQPLCQLGDEDIWSTTRAMKGELFYLGSIVVE